MRADAVRRRTALIREARHLFARTGADVALESVADRAGVGIGTLYRNFDSRADLAEHVALAILADLDAATARAVADLPTGPEDAWRAYVDSLVALELGALTAALSAELGTLEDPLREAQERTLAAVDALLVDVRTAGLVPARLGALELVVAVGIVTRPLPDRFARAAPDLAEHLVDALVAGLRAQAGHARP